MDRWTNEETRGGVINGMVNTCRICDLLQWMIFMSLLVSDKAADPRHVGAHLRCIQMPLTCRPSIPNSGWRSISAHSYQAHLFIGLEWIRQLATSVPRTHLRARWCIMMKWNVNNLWEKVEAFPKRTTFFVGFAVFSVWLCLIRSRWNCYARRIKDGVKDPFGIFLLCMPLIRPSAVHRLIPVCHTL